jgi:hypothetical protein
MFLMAQVLGHLLIQRPLQHRLGQLFQQPLLASQRHALLPGTGHQLLRKLLLSGRLRLVLPLARHAVYCRGHHGPLPPSRQAQRDRAGNTVRSTVLGTTQQ